MKKILITGAGGFVGNYLVRELKSLGGYEIFATVHKPNPNLSELVGSDHVISGDLTDYSFTQNLITQTSPDVIYHLAALSVVHNSHNQAETVINVNATISYNLLEAFRLYAPKARLIAICSANVYGAVQDRSKPLSESTPLRPLNPYAVSKVTQEMLALQYHLAYGLDIVILRPFNHTGPGQTTDFVIPALAQQFAQIAKGAPPVIEVGNLSTKRDFTDVRDMVKAYILASEMGKSGEVYNIGSGHGYTVRELIDLLQKVSGITVELKTKAGLVRKSDVAILIANATKFRELTHWEPKISLEATLSDILNYYRK